MSPGGPPRPDHYVLCVDDDPDFLKSLEFFLPEEVRRAGTGGVDTRFLFLNCPEEALSTLRELREAGRTVAMVLTDEKMPHMTGTDLLAEVKRLFPRTVRVLLTGHAGMESAIRAINENLLDKYLTKPIENEHDFTVTIRLLLDRFRMQRVIEDQSYTIDQNVRELSETSESLRQEIRTRTRAEEALKASQEQLRQSLKMDALGRLAGGIAHDFNNILTSIIGRSELILRSLGKGDPVRVRTEEIRASAQRAADLTQQLLAFSRKQVLQPKVLDPNEVVDGLAKMLRSVMSESIEFRIEKAADLGRVRADAGQLGQVVMNLVINARDAMPDGGTLTIETANAELDEAQAAALPGGRAGRYVAISVRDTGCGIDEAIRERVFEPFFTTKGPNRGTGLGLATVYGIVSQSGGAVALDSEPGRGTTFTVYLPRTDESPADRPEPAQGAPAGGGSEVVLLLEDDPDLRELAREILALSGYRVLPAAHGAEALEIRDRHPGPIHLMITDVVMPRMSGREAFRRLAPRCPGMKVLYMSGYADDVILDRGALEAGSEFLQKPFTPDALVRKVREVLQAPVSAGPEPVTTAAHPDPRSPR